MATFRCIQSGNTVTFKHQVDIDSMKGHTGYVRVEEPIVEPKPVVHPLKKLGRPFKIKELT